MVTVGREIASKSKLGRCCSGSFEFSVAVPSRLVVLLFLLTECGGVWGLAI